MGVVREFLHSFSIAHARVSRELGVEWTPARVTRFWMRMVVSGAGCCDALAACLTSWLDHHNTSAV